MTNEELIQFSLEFRRGLIGEQKNASRYMCTLVALPLRAALKVFADFEAELNCSSGHTTLRTQSGMIIDPTFDQFGNESKVAILDCEINHRFNDYDRTSSLEQIQFVELLEEYKRIKNCDHSPFGVGAFIAKYIYMPLAREGVFDDRGCGAG